MTAGRVGHAPGVHLDFEPFAVANGFERFPLAVPGVCFNPSCGRRFDPSRVWQVYCCAECRKSGEREFVRIGTLAAPALLAWRAGKYETRDPDLRDIASAGRRYIGNLQTRWVQSRAERMA